MRRRPISITGIIISLIFLLIIANAPKDNDNEVVSTQKPKTTAVATTKPDKTGKPTKTEKPVKTEKPTQTDKPVKTAKPVKTNKPASTKAPNNVENTGINDIPAYDTSPYVIINGNIPFFTSEEITAEAFEYYSEQDELGRCGMVWACIGQEIMPTEERGSIGHVRPAGWHTVKYDVVDGLYLYNRCHLIGYQLAGENDNINNLITGTRYLNVVGMLPFENQVANYVENTGNHVMYRVTPIYEGNNLLANGVLMEAYSVEDEGEGLCYNVFVYNVQPGIIIDYATGDSYKKE